MVTYEEDAFDERLCLHSELAVDERRIFISACDGLRALRRSDGEQLWSVGSPLRSGVTAVDGRVYANGDDLLAIDTEAGEIAWQVPTGGEHLTRPAATEDVVVFTNRVDGVVTAFDTDGEQRWTYRTETETRSPTIADGTVYVATAPVPGREGRLLALDIEDGEMQWNVETPSLKRGTRPVVDADAIYIGCNGRDNGRLVVRSSSSYSAAFSGVVQPRQMRSIIGIVSSRSTTAMSMNCSSRSLLGMREWRGTSPPASNTGQTPAIVYRST